ncbi:pilus assembly protein [Chitinibacteraceae bacterium HSL-7]
MNTRSFKLAVLPALIFSALSQAAVIDIASKPMANTTASVVKPNIMFILDDSTSMDYEWLPDGVISGSNTSVPSSTTVSNYKNSNLCFSNAQHNKIYYDPTVTYSPPVDASGVSYANASYPSAKNDGYSASNSTTNLSTWYYSTLKSNFNGDASACNNNNKYDKINVSTLTAAQQTNFANWFSYYRKRIYTAKAATGFAFQGISDAYRVGFSSIHNTGTSESGSNEFLNVRTFDQTQKNAFFQKFLGVDLDGGTPLRTSLSWAGRYYANQLSSQSADPVQYACQKNNTILFTDGYWNGGGGAKLNGNAMDNQDSSATEDPPYEDAFNKSDTLADTAMYYYKTDLRDGSLNNCSANGNPNVCSDSGSTEFDTQRMYTYTIGFGVSGVLQYTDNYDNPASGDFLAIKQGTKNWGDPIANTAGPRIDDLWHAAVNGRGHYFSVDNADQLATSLRSALNRIDSRSGSSAAAATSNLEPVAGDNFVYVALYRTQDWYGDLIATTLDINTGAVALRLDNTSGAPVSGTYQWSAKDQLESKASISSDTRNIYFFNSAVASTKLSSFTYANLSATQKTLFANVCVGTKISQCASMTAADQTTANNGTNLVNYLRGQRAYEGADTFPALYRSRAARLGDIVNAVPVYVQKPPFNYADTGYTSFVSSNASRTGVVYSAANDGMLHAFNASTGAELWAYVPSMVMSDMYRLADNAYANNHRYYVDGSPTLADVYIGGAWKSVLIGGLNAGGKGYYALDVTNPSSPKGLWELTNSTTGIANNLGYTYGNPVVTKLADGTWVALITSGYNNTDGDGNGHLFVVRISDGTVLYDIETQISGTDVGSVATPSGLGKVNAWIDSDVDNTADYAYAGDMLGNVWRFDINNTQDPAGREAHRIARAMAGSTPQPITTKIEPAEISTGAGTKRALFFATGRYLGTSDISDTTQQSVYGIKEELDAGDLGVLRDRADIVEQVITKSGDVASISDNTVDWATKVGWYADLPSSGERVNVDMQQQFNTLTVASNIPAAASSCVVSGGSSWLYYFDIRNGSSLASAGGNVGSKYSSDALIAGIKTIKLPGNKVVTIVTDTSGQVVGKDDPTSSIAPGGPAKRTSWRELVE